jgi:gas vesicle protein
MAENDGGAGFWTGVLVGGIVGVVAGVLFAPKSGEETRALIGEKTGEWRDRAEELAESTRDRVHSAMDEGRAAATRAGGESLILDDDDFDDPV